MRREKALALRLAFIANIFSTSVCVTVDASARWLVRVNEPQWEIHTSIGAIQEQCCGSCLLGKYISALLHLQWSRRTPLGASRQVKYEVDDSGLEM
jgi:hypothetical protein